MRKLLCTNLLGLAGLLAVSSSPSIALVPLNVATIINSGSTNTIGYRIYVNPSGQANYVDGKGEGQGTIPQRLTRKFFKDLQTAKPLSTLPVRQPCIKPTSFGTSTTIKLGAEQSPDISCPGNAKAWALDNDVIAIAKFLKVTNVPITEGKPLPPQNF